MLKSSYIHTLRLDSTQCFFVESRLDSLGSVDSLDSIQDSIHWLGRLTRLDSGLDSPNVATIESWFKNGLTWFTLDSILDSLDSLVTTFGSDSDLIDSLLTRVLNYRTHFWFESGLDRLAHRLGFKYFISYTVSTRIDDRTKRFFPIKKISITKITKFFENFEVR